MIARFTRFEIDLPAPAVDECSAQGDCAQAVVSWSTKIPRPAELTPEKLRDELREYGAWTEGELDDDVMNWERIIWIAAGNIKEEAVGN